MFISCSPPWRIGVSSVLGHGHGHGRSSSKTDLVWCGDGDGTSARLFEVRWMFNEAGKGKGAWDTEISPMCESNRLLGAC